MTPQHFDNQGPHQDGPDEPIGSNISGPSDPTSRFHANFAHELANLLDGSLRNVALVMASLRQLDPPAGKLSQNSSQSDNLPDTQLQPENQHQNQHVVQPPSPELVHRLETANTAMQQMAMMIQQLLASQKGSQATAAAAASLHAAPDTFTLAAAADHVIQLLKPIADEHHIELQLDIDAQAASLPVGPLFPVIVNAVRNSLQAIASFNDDQHNQHNQHGRHREPFIVQVNASIIHNNQLQLTIQDNGPGLDPVTLDDQGRFRYGTTTRAQGHGLGLPLARDIIQTLGGQIQITGQGRNNTTFDTHTHTNTFNDHNDQYTNADASEHLDEQQSEQLSEHLGTQLTIHVPLNRLVTSPASPASPNS